MAFTRPKAAQIDFDITNITDPLIRLNSGETGNADKDVGIVIERGDDTNVAIIYDESADQFVLVNTTETGTTSGNVTISSYAGLQADAIVYGSLNDGTTTLTATVAELNILDGVTATATELNYTDGVTSNIQTQLDAKAPTATPTFTGNATFDTNTLFVDASNNRIGVGTTSPAYQVEIENTGANALLVLDRTDGAGCFIEGQATRSAFGSVGATPLALAYNSAAVVTIGASGAITVNPDGANPYTFPTTDGSANQVLQTDGSGTLTFADQSGGLSNIVEDTTPQLGGMLDVNGNAIGDGTLELLKFSETASAVNEFTIANAATGNGPTLSATGGDTNIDINITPKGTGEVVIGAGNLNYGGTAVTATGAELNILDGVTATTAELNYVDGVTSNIQTQLDAKLALAGGTMSGAIAMGTNKITGMGDPTANQDAATKAYVDTQTSSIVTTTDIAGDTGTDTVTLGSDTLTFSGTANEITTAVTDNTVTISLPDDVTIGSDLTVTGNLTVNGTTTTISTTNSVVADSLIELNTGAASNANDLGIVMERGSTGDNAIIAWDESADKFIVGTTTATGASTGDLTITTGTLVANVEGNVTGNLTGDVTGNADTTTALATARNIAGNSFDGTGDITIASTDLSDTSNLVRNNQNNTITSTTAGSSAAPEFELFRDITGADANYIGQIKFSADNDADSKTVFAKITGKIGDASSGSEDGIIEIAHQKAGSNNINVRMTSTEFKIMNGTDFDVETHDGSSTGLRLANTLVTATAAELNILDGVTATTAELNILDGDTAATSTTLVDADRFVVNDAGTMVQVAASDVATYIGAASSVFKTISVSGQSDVVADSNTDTLTLAEGTGVTITTDASTDTITFTVDSGASVFASDHDLGNVADSAGTTEDLGNVADSHTTSQDLGTITVQGIVVTGSIIDGNVTAAKLSGLTDSSNGFIQADGDGTFSIGTPAAASITDGTSTLNFNGSNQVQSDASIVPNANGTLDLGTSALRWQNIYTSDLNLSNGVGDYTVVEGEEDLFLYNNKSGKVFKFALIEVDPSEATPKIEDLKNGN